MPFSAAFEMYFRFSIPANRLRETMLPGMPQNLPKSMDMKFICRWNSPATGSSQWNLADGSGSSYRRYIARLQFRTVIKSPLSITSLSLTTLSVSSSRFAISSRMFIVPAMVPSLNAKVGSGKILASSSLHLTSGNSDGHCKALQVAGLQKMRLLGTKAMS